MINVGFVANQKHRQRAQRPLAEKKTHKRIKKKRHHSIEKSARVTCRGKRRLRCGRSGTVRHMMWCDGCDGCEGRGASGRENVRHRANVRIGPREFANPVTQVEVGVAVTHVEHEQHAWRKTRKKTGIQVDSTSASQVFAVP